MPAHPSFNLNIFAMSNPICAFYLLCMCGGGVRAYLLMTSMHSSEWLSANEHPYINFVDDLYYFCSYLPIPPYLSQKVEIDYIAINLLPCPHALERTPTSANGYSQKPQPLLAISELLLANLVKGTVAMLVFLTIY